MMLQAAWAALGIAGLPQRTDHLTTGSSGSCLPVRTATVSGDAVASAAIRRRQDSSLLRVTLGISLSTGYASKNADSGFTGEAVEVLM